MNLDAKVCRCGHTAHWHGALYLDPRPPRETMGQGPCDSCDCARFDEARTDSYSSLRARIRELETALVEIPEADAATPGSRGGAGGRLSPEMQASFERQQAAVAPRRTGESRGGRTTR